MDRGPCDDADRLAAPRVVRVEGTWRLLKRHGWSWQQLARRAIERDDSAVGLWEKEVWSQGRASRRPVTDGSSTRARPVSR
ncbi:winged helix-turn-helix domain-containing protein [Streptomyces sp. NPDC056542]|uniref:winged helix-turn-helix domain-containing protein n=1 Tax=unclassified Streptomyces TaxID=2593676 RepID=UPI00368ADD2D